MNASLHHHSPLSVAYATSLLDLAMEQGNADEIGQELTQLRGLLDQNPIFGEFLRDPGIGHEERSSALEKIFAGRVSPLLWNFLRVLSDKGRLGLLLHLDEVYDDLLDERLGKVEVDVTVAQRLGEDQLEQVRQRVSEALGKQAVVHQYVDEAILGGLVLRVQDRVIDASVRAQLKSMRQQILAGLPRVRGAVTGM